MGWHDQAYYDNTANFRCAWADGPTIFLIILFLRIPFYLRSWTFDFKHNFNRYF